MYLAGADMDCEARCRYSRTGGQRTLTATKPIVYSVYVTKISPQDGEKTGDAGLPEYAMNPSVKAASQTQSAGGHCSWTAGCWWLWLPVLTKNYRPVWMSHQQTESSPPELCEEPAEDQCQEFWQANMLGIPTLLAKAQLSWTGHVTRMPRTRLPKQVFFFFCKSCNQHTSYWINAVYLIIRCWRATYDVFMWSLDYRIRSLLQRQTYLRIWPSEVTTRA